MKRKKALWIQHTHLLHKDEYECSACNCCVDKPYVICPNCGASMKGSKYDPSWVDEMEAIEAMFND